MATGPYTPPGRISTRPISPRLKADMPSAIEEAVELMGAKRPMFYAAAASSIRPQGVEAADRACAHLTGFPITLTLMGLGAFRRRQAVPGHARHARHLRGQPGDARLRRDDRIGARFDDRVTGRLDAFSPNSKKIHVDIDPSARSTRTCRWTCRSSAMWRTCWKT
jgi:acetolactate synthase-1/2/3 large subunit